MLVVADSSPLVAMINIGCLDVLPALFGQVVITPLIAQELTSPKRPESVRQTIVEPPPWLVVRSPTALQAIPIVHAGECEAISLACELKADLLLIDDRAGRKAALERQLVITGTVGVLERAAERGLVVLEEAFARLKQTDFRINRHLLDLRLHRHKQSGPDRKGPRE